MKPVTVGLCAVVLVLVSFSFNVSAQNYHEHFYYWTSYDNLEKAHYTVYRKSLDSILAKHLLPLNDVYSTRIFESHMSRLVGPFPKNSEEKFYGLHLKILNQDLTLLRVANELQRISGRQIRYSKFIRGFFEFSDRGENNREGFLAIEAVRKRLYKYLSKKDPEKFRQFMRLAAQLQAQQSDPHLEISVSDSYWLSDIEEYYNTIKLEGVNVRIYYAYPRRKLILDDEKEFELKLHHIETAIRGGWCEGVDVAGSLYGPLKELMQKNWIKYSVQNRLTRIAELLSKYEKKTMRIHAFEVSGKGGFYKSLEDFLENLKYTYIKNKLEIRFGHFAKLKKFSLKKLSNVQKKNVDKIEISFDFPFFSNLHVANQSPLQLLINLSHILQYEFPVYLGADGLGIYGAQSSSRNLIRSIEENWEKHNDSKFIDEVLIHQFLDSKKSQLCKMAFL